MNVFLDEAIQLIENLGFKSTVGNRSFSDILDISSGAGQWGGVGW